MNEQNMQLVEWAEKIPMEELWDELRRITGLPDLKFTYKIINNDARVSIKFESQDLVDKVGFLKLIFREIKISQFSSKVEFRSENDEEFFLFWSTIDFSYKHPSGGSNGKDFMTAYYTDRKGWEYHYV